MISGGFPCQPFSYAGKKRGLDDIRGTVFFHFANLIEKIKPNMILAENVKGLIQHQKGRTFQTILSTFEGMGYQVYWKVLNAWDYEVAQKRERVFIVGVHKSYSTLPFDFPIPSMKKPVLKDVLQEVPISNGYAYPKHKAEVLKLVPAGGCHRDLPEDIAKSYMGKSFYLTGGRTGIARRIVWDEPSLTLITSPMQKQTERCHPEETISSIKLKKALYV